MDFLDFASALYVIGKIEGIGENGLLGPSTAVSKDNNSNLFAPVPRFCRLCIKLISKVKKVHGFCVWPASI